MTTTTIKKRAVRCSSLDLAGKCPGSVRLKDQYGSGSPAARLGTAIHAGMVSRLNDQPVDAEQLRIEYGLSAEDTDEAVRLIRGVLLTYKPDEWVLDTEKSGTVDLHMRAVDPQNHKAILSGTMDLLARKKSDASVAEITDWKSGREEVGHAQLLGYAILVFAAHPEIMTVKARMVYLRLRTVSEQTFKREQIEQWWLWLKPFLQRCKSVDPDYTTGEHCAWCHPTMCKAWRDVLPAAYDAPEALVPGETEKAALQKRLIEVLPKLSAVEKACDRIRELAKAIAPITLPNGLVFENRPQEQEVIEAATAAPILKQSGIDIISLIKKIPKSGLADACREKNISYAALLDELTVAGAVTVKIVDRFSIYKPVPPPTETEKLPTQPAVATQPED